MLSKSPPLSRYKANRGKKKKKEMFDAFCPSCQGLFPQQLAQDTTLRQIFFSDLYLFDSILSIIVWINSLHKGICFLATTAIFSSAKKKRCFIGYFHLESSRACHPYFMDFLGDFINGKYHRDMKILKILASDSKQLRVYGIFKIMIN